METDRALPWLLEPDSPGVRYLALRDLVHASGAELQSARRAADLLRAWDRFVRSVFSSFARHNRTSEMGDVAPQRLDETALLFAKAGLRRSIDLLQAWHRFVVATFSNLSQRAAEMLRTAAAADPDPTKSHRSPKAEDDESPSCCCEAGTSSFASPFRV